jgi:hypothetical protein
MLHVVVLAGNQAAQVQHNAASFVTLPENRDIGVLESGELFPVPLTLPLELLGNFLLKNKCLEGIIALLLGTGKTDGQASIVVLLLVDKATQTAVLALVVLNLDLEILGLLGECLSKCLELEELLHKLAKAKRQRSTASIKLTCCFQLSNSSTR